MLTIFMGNQFSMVNFYVNVSCLYNNELCENNFCQHFDLQYNSALLYSLFKNVWNDQKKNKKDFVTSFYKVYNILLQNEEHQYYDVWLNRQSYGSTLWKNLFSHKIK